MITFKSNKILNINMVSWKDLINLIKKQKKRKSKDIHQSKEGHCKYCSKRFNDLENHMKAKHKNRK